MDRRLSFVAGMALCTCANGQATFTGVGTPNSTAFDVSADGGVIAGKLLIQSSFGGFRWTPGVGLQLLPTPAGFYDVLPAAIDAEGEMITGNCHGPGHGTHLYLWSASTGAADLGTMQGQMGQIYGCAVSRDGSRVVGYAETNLIPLAYRAFQWTPSGGITALDPNESRAFGLTRDGAVILGASGPRLAEEAYMWTNSGPVALGRPVGSTWSWVANSDTHGAVLAGACGTNTSSQAAVWTAQEGWHIVGGTPGYAYSYATGISGTGKTVVGTSTDPNVTANSPWIWARDMGVRRLHDYLRWAGADLGAWSLQACYGISEDGRTLVGVATRAGQSEGFVARLPAEPCYANCDQSTSAPTLNVLDFLCFLQRFGSGYALANCDQSTQEPVLNVADFTCFLQKFAAGCP